MEEQELSQSMGTRRGKLGVLTRKRNEINALMEAGDTKEEVQKLAWECLKYMEEFAFLQRYVQDLLPDEEKEHDQNEWYEPKAAHFKEFLDGVELWLKAIYL